ncbi:hypothetical protein ACWGHA_25970 [Streptomyces xanthophaeus]
MRLPQDDSAELSNALFDAVDALIETYGADEVAEIVALAVHAGRATPGQAATFLNVAAWSGTDNGASSCETLIAGRRAD